MKKLYSLVSIVILSAAAIIFVAKKNEISTSKFPGYAGSSIYSSEGRAEWETLRLADPTTGTIPSGIRTRELAFSTSLPQYSSSSLARMGAAFFSRGPENMGGRTRAIAIDVTDENIFFAGSVNGGLWRSTDAGASWTLVSSLNQNPAITSITQDRRPGHTSTWYYTTGEGLGASSGASGAYYLGNGVFK